MIIYHNPRCRKSREALALLQENGIEPTVREYLKETPTVAEIKEVLAMLNIPAKELVRKEEEIYKKEYKNLNLNEEEWVQVMVENPKLIQRPIVIKNKKAIIGRPPQEVLNLVD